jgi:hypothetical protein
MNILFTNPGATDWYLHDLLIAIEEGFELFGSTFFLLYFLLNALRKRDSEIVLKTESVVKNTSKRINSFAIMSVFGLIISMFLFFLFWGGKLPKGDSGIPLNWFPSVLSFWIFILLALENSSAENSFISPGLKTILMLTFLFFSAFWGANLYPFLEWERLGIFRWLVKAGIILTLLLTGIYLDKSLKNRFLKYGWSSFIFLLVLTLILNKNLSPVIGTFACLLVFSIILFTKTGSLYSNR